jgi:excisionase family DNA binding protein
VSEVAVSRSKARAAKGGAVSKLGALLADLDPDDLRDLAQRLAPYLPTPTAPVEDRWLTTREAATYLGMTTTALHKLTASRSVPFEQSGPRARCYFRRADLDEWRRSQC